LTNKICLRPRILIEATQGILEAGSELLQGFQGRLPRAHGGGRKIASYGNTEKPEEEAKR
jgi:hypothetical protein